jgi:hypothetical protein
MPFSQPERSRTGSPARLMPGMLSAIALKISSISSRARLAPRQKWAPLPAQPAPPSARAGRTGQGR